MNEDEKAKHAQRLLSEWIVSEIEFALVYEDEELADEDPQDLRDILDKMYEERAALIWRAWQYEEMTK